MHFEPTNFSHIPPKFSQQRFSKQLSRSSQPSVKDTDLLLTDFISASDQSVNRVIPKTTLSLPFWAFLINFIFLTKFRNRSRVSSLLLYCLSYLKVEMRRSLTLCVILCRLLLVILRRGPPSVGAKFP